MGFRNPIRTVTADDVGSGAFQGDYTIDGLFTVGNPAAGHIEIGTNGGGETGVRLYAADGTTVLIDFDAPSASGTFEGDIVGSNITGSTVTGGTVQTAASGKRIALTSGNELLVYDSTGALVGILDANAGMVTLATGDGLTTIGLRSDHVIQLVASGGILTSAAVTVGSLHAGTAGISSSGPVTGASSSVTGAASCGGVMTATGGVSTPGNIVASGGSSQIQAPTIFGTTQVQAPSITSTSTDVVSAQTVTCNNPPLSASAANVIIGAGGRLNKFSSRRKWKTRIRRLRRGEAYAALGLRGVSFQAKAEAKTNPDARRYWGLIAEEVAAVHPELVDYDEKGHPETPHWPAITVALIEVVKDLQKRAQAAGI